MKLSEVERLQIENAAQATRIRELEGALARCVGLGVQLSEVLRYIDDPEIVQGVFPRQTIEQPSERVARNG